MEEFNPGKIPPYYLTKEEKSWRDGFSWCEWERHGKHTEQKKEDEEVDKNRRILEAERITNLVRGFGWELEATTEKDETLTISFKKTISSEPLAPIAP